MIEVYPEEIEKLVQQWRSYGKKIYNGELQGVPEEAVEAFYKYKKWAWEQGQ